MNILDILVLAKQGYKPNDIKELISMAEEKTTVDEPKPGTETEPVIEQPDNKHEINTSELESRLKELEEQNKLLSEQLAAAQHANVNKDLSGNYKTVDPVAELCELFRKG